MGSTHQFKWDQQGSRVLEQLRSLYGDQEGIGDALGIQPDVVLFTSDGACVEAHKVILALCSPYFQQLFVKISQNQLNHQRCRDAPTVVVLGNVKACQLKQLLQFIYTGEVTVPSDQMEEFLELGRAFEIEGIAHSSSSKNSTNNILVNVPQNSSRPSLRSAKKSNDKPIVQSPFANVTPVYAPVTPEDDNSMQNCFDEEVDIDLEATPVKIELESTEMDNLTGDPLGFDMDHMELNSSGEDDNYEDDPPYQEDPPAPKRSRQNNHGRSSHLLEWVEQEPLSDEYLKSQWHIKKQDQSDTCSTTWYICALGGSKCPARLKKKVMKDGTVIWWNNKVPHDPHPEKRHPRGLTPEQKQFVLQCLKGGVTKVSDIIREFELEGIAPPKWQKIHYYLKINESTSQANAKEPPTSRPKPSMNVPGL